MRKLNINIILSTLLIFIFFNSVFAWDDTGHKLTAFIAWEQMTPQARENAFKTLTGAPEDSDLSAFYLQDSRSEDVKKRELFMIAATWADIVRDKNFKVRYEKYHHGNWHYSDTFWTSENGQIKPLPNPAGDDGGQAVVKLAEFEKVLQNASASAPEKAIALAWFLHLAGDMHQPLHASARVTKYDPKGDQGGNLFYLTPEGTPREQQLNLHWFWDSIIGRVAERRDLPDEIYFPFLARQIMTAYPVAEFQTELKDENFDDWRKESVLIAQTKLYPADLKFGENPSSIYRREAFNIAEHRIALAGYRMGVILNRIFGTPLSAGIKQKDYDKNRADWEKDKGTSIIGQGANDSWIWLKTRSAFAATNDLRESTINVDVTNDVITLKGTVADAEQKAKAETVAKGIDGVKAVKNELKIKP